MRPSDEELATAAQTGSEDAALAEATLLTRYRPFVRAKARSYFLVGGDDQDVVQEGMIGLFKAIRDYDSAEQMSFRGFAELCVTRQLITAVKSATRYKHGPLNSYVSFSRTIGDDDDGERVLADVLPASPQDDPAERLTSAERVRDLQAYVDDALSDLEVEVLRMYVEGRSYVEMAEILSRRTKSVDNALQRIKRKIDGHLREREVAEQG
ncbi:MAG TPA: RNA polymerase sporulation sigma factor SigH [Frankiaceae bacterium]|jgi:RNA polymerase sporulation-specific sigma factor|nr:RNA polymerase sporulation sigma factor SigH [Frankiaceae bacterium]